MRAISPITGVYSGLPALGTNVYPGLPALGTKVYPGLAAPVARAYTFRCAFNITLKFQIQNHFEMSRYMWMFFQRNTDTCFGVIFFFENISFMICHVKTLDT